MKKSALLVLDVINDLVHEQGSVGQDGFFAEANRRQLLTHLSKAITQARRQGIPVFYVVVGFNPDYREWSEKSKLFRHVKEKHQVVLGEWATEIHDIVKPEANETVIAKHRIDPFFNTSLELLLKVQGIDELILTGVSSEFVVLSTAMSAHDRDFQVTVLEDCISSSDPYSHECAVHIINKVADLSYSDTFFDGRG